MYNRTALTHRANRVGAMLIVMTMCQHGIPRIGYYILSLFGVDTSAQSWGLKSAAYLTLYLLLYVLMMGINQGGSYNLVFWCK